ncbi:hypothetical protein RQN30_03015 [Arcanobacterium hippocoleae]
MKGVQLMRSVAKRVSGIFATLISALVLVFAGTGIALADEGNASNETAMAEPQFSINKDDNGNVLVTLEKATVSFDNSYKSPSIFDANGDSLGSLPTNASVGEVNAIISYVPVDDNHFIVNYFTDRFDWGCYGKGIVAGTVGGAAGGAALGAVSGLPFVPVEPVTITGGITGLVGGIVGGVIACW